MATFTPESAGATDVVDSDPAPVFTMGEFRILERIAGQDLSGPLAARFSSVAPPADRRFLRGIDVSALYRGRAYRPLFLTDEAGHRVGENLLTQIAQAATQGLDPARYRADAIKALLETLPAIEERREWWRIFKSESPDLGSPDSLALLDALLADRYLALGYDLRFGELDGPPRAKPAEPVKGKAATAVPLPESLAVAAVASDTLLTRLSAGAPPPVTDWAPAHEQYALLRQALKDYRRVARNGGWPAVDAVTKTIRPGAEDRRVAQARARLDAEDALLAGRDVPPPPPNAARFDTTLASRLRAFQERHCLEPDGSLGKLTVEELAVPADARVRQIELTLARWRMGPGTEPEPRVEVNTPSMTLNVWNGGRSIWTTRTVVGSGKQSAAWLGKTSKAQTPELYDEIETIEVNPFWYIPEIIIRTELMQKEKRKPGFLDRGGYEWYDPSTGKSGGLASEIPEEDWANPAKRLRLRQRAGGGNSLGRIKFLFHNAFAVYLHDTPDKHYFKKARRNFSHGCVRVQNPAALAETLLTFTTAKRPEKPVEQLMKSSARKVLEMKPPLPIHLLYRTVWVQPDGRIDFLPDLYKWDAELAARLWPTEQPLAGTEAAATGGGAVRRAPSGSTGRKN